MPTRTICCKLDTLLASADALGQTAIVFADARTYVLHMAIAKETYNAIKLHKLCYTLVRQTLGLSASLAVRSIHRVAGCLTNLKGKRRPPKEFKPKSIDYDARIFSYRESDQTVSLNTVQGRIRTPLILGEYQRNALKGQKPTAATVINKRGVWYIHIVIKVEPISCQGHAVMGVDLGINNIATTSTGLNIEGKSRQEFKEKRATIRASLQSKGKRSTKKVLKKLSGYEKRRITHENHLLSKQLVEEAKRHNCATIRMEQLKGVRNRTKKWDKHRNRETAGWSFYELQQFVAYKATAVGIRVEFVNPAYTSQTCHHCLKLGSRQGERFNCVTCGEQHADVNASHVIALGGVVRKPARISSAS